MGDYGEDAGPDGGADGSTDDGWGDFSPPSRDSDVSDPAREPAGDAGDDGATPDPPLGGPDTDRGRDSGGADRTGGWSGGEGRTTGRSGRDEGTTGWSGGVGPAPAPAETGRRPRGRGRRETEGPTDPVQEQWRGRVDLYDVATWESRSTLDSIAVAISNTLSVSRGTLLLATALVLFGAQMVVLGALVLEEPMLAILTALSIVPALGLAGYIWYGDPTTREPFVLLAVTFILSMLLATVAALVNETFIPVFEAAGAIGLLGFYFVVVGPIEELVKWIAIRAYAYKSEVFRTVADGAVYGAAAGLGFAAIENFTYIGLAFVGETPIGISQESYAAFLAGQRAFAGPGHVIFSAWAGFYLGLAKFNPKHKGPIVVKGLLIAIFIHALYNSLVTLLPLTFLALLAFILVYHGFWFWMLYRKISSYRSLYKQIGSPTPPGDHPSSD